MIAALLLGLALADDPAPPPPVCDPTKLEQLPAPPERLAVAWVGRWRQRPSGALRVVPTSELSGWIAAQRPAWTGRTLQRLGLRRRNTDPRRRFKVVVFDVQASDLCRPIDGVDKGTPIAGSTACAPRHARNRKSTGCGHTQDRKTGAPGFTQFVVRRRDAVDSGHCVVPLERYLEQVAR